MSADRPLSSASAPSRIGALTGLLLAVVLLAGCSSTPEPSEAAESRPESPTVTEATLEPAVSPGDGRTYNPAAAPLGATVRVESAPTTTDTTVRLAVEGLRPNRGYAVHAHVRPCGPTGADAGPHFQNREDPAATPERPSADRAYANPQNEIWLDVRTDRAGAGTSQASVPFVLGERGPASVVVHEKMATSTAPGMAGTAGGRLACVTLR